MAAKSKKESTTKTNNDECNEFAFDIPEADDTDYRKYAEGRHARTFMLPLEDSLYSALLNMEKEGRAAILNKQYCACPKESMILVLCEFDVYY